MEFKSENITYNRDVRDMYDHFMVFELLDTGERQQLNITEDEFRRSKGAGILHPKQVAIIVQEDYRRIYIWKGTEPHVRKKFIASRVAQELQTEMVQIGHLHRCKVVTIEQGDETKEFLRVFGFELDEMAKATGFTGESTQIPMQKITRQAPTTSPLIEKKTLSIKHNQSNKTIPSQSKVLQVPKLGNLTKEKLEKILKFELPKDYKRKNILTGQNTLFGLITKKVEIFGKSIEETEWEPVKNLPEGVFELDGHKLRIHYNEESGIEAIEILEPTIKMKKETLKIEKHTEEDEGKVDYNKWTVKDLKAYCVKNGIKVPSSYRKAQIIQLVKDHTI